MTCFWFQTKYLGYVELLKRMQAKWIMLIIPVNHNWRLYLLSQCVNSDTLPLDYTYTQQGSITLIKYALFFFSFQDKLVLGGGKYFVQTIVMHSEK